MKFFVFLFLLSFPILANAEDTYCTRLAASAFNECKTENASSPEDLKTCPETRNEMRKDCYAQLATIKSQVGFLTYMNSAKYAPLGDKIIHDLESTELTEDALTRYVSDYNFNSDIYEVIQPLKCVPEKAEDSNCPFLEPGDSDVINLYHLNNADYLIAVYSPGISEDDNAAYIVYLLHSGSIYDLGTKYGVDVDTGNKIVATYIKGKGEGDYGSITLSKIDVGAKKLKTIQSFITDSNYKNETGAADAPYAYIKRAKDYISAKKYRLEAIKGLNSGLTNE